MLPHMLGVPFTASRRTPMPQNVRRQPWKGLPPNAGYAADRIVVGACPD
jgi:hypothetical protein